MLPDQRPDERKWAEVGGAIQPMAEADWQYPDYRQPPHRRRMEYEIHAASRQLLLFWCIWLLGSWGGALVIYRGLLVQPAIRWMILSAMFGQMLLAPVIRLSQRSPVATWAIVSDWISMNLVLQAVIWPLRIGTRWSAAQTWWLCGAIAAWSLLSAAITSWGCRSRGWAERTVAAGLCAVLLFGEPVVLALFNLEGAHPRWYWLQRISPIRSLVGLTGAPGDWDPSLWRESVLWVVAAAAAAWLVVLLFNPWGRED